MSAPVHDIIKEVDEFKVHVVVLILRCMIESAAENLENNVHSVFPALL